MKKKTILMAAIAVMLVAVLVVGGTLAYFTDTKSATNTFTMGNVKIALDEQQKGENGLEAFEQNKTLVPGKSNDGNAVSKIVTVKNTGANDAWVWVELKIPAYIPPTRARTLCTGTATAASTLSTTPVTTGSLPPATALSTQTTMLLTRRWLLSVTASGTTTSMLALKQSVASSTL